MKIAYVYDAVYPWVTGGVEKRVWELAKRLAADHDVHWYGLHYWDGPATIKREGVTLHGVAEPPELYVDDRRSITEAITFAAALAPSLLSEEFDVVDCQEFPYFPCFTSKLNTGLKGGVLCVTWHEVWGNYWYEYLGGAGMFGKVIEWMTARIPDAHIAVSERTSRDVRELGVKMPVLIPNGIDVESVASITPADRTIDLLYAGRLLEHKNVELLLRAIAQLTATRSAVQCVIIGEGPERARLERLATELGISEHTSFTDFRERHEDVLGLMKAADVFVSPSEREGFGMTVLEALASGTPVVTTDAPRNAASELVTDGETGAVCPPTPEGLSQGLQRALELDSEQACVAAAENYDWNRIAERIERTYMRYR